MELGGLFQPAGLFRPAGPVEWREIYLGESRLGREKAKAAGTSEAELEDCHFQLGPIKRESRRLNQKAQGRLVKNKAPNLLGRDSRFLPRQSAGRMVGRPACPGDGEPERAASVAAAGLRHGGDNFCQRHSGAGDHSVQWASGRICIAREILSAACRRYQILFVRLSLLLE